MLIWWTIAGCFTPAPEPPPPAVDPEEQALSKARELASEAAKTMQSSMVQEIGNPGPEGDIVAGSSEPDALTLWHNDLPQGPVGRSSLRLRNPANHGPAWVQEWLQKNAKASFSDVEGFARIATTTEGKKVARVLQPIEMKKGCVRCHGGEEQIPPDVRDALSDRFPTDEALGYKVGDLRGAMWAEVPVD